MSSAAAQTMAACRRGGMGAGSSGHVLVRRVKKATTGTFLMLVFIHLGKMDTRHAAGGVKVINLASNIGGVCSALMAGTVVLGVGLAAALASILGHYLGAGLAIRNGSKIVRPAVVVELLLLLVKVISELLFPNFWN